MAISDTDGGLAFGGVPVPAGGAGEGVLRRLPAVIRDSLTAEQQEAIRRAGGEPAWRGHGVNIRLSLPFPGRRFYLTIVGGPERRPPPRRAAERADHPLHTFANSFFVAGVALFFYALVLVGIFLHAAIIEF